jgi:hypothetical protein
MIFVETIRDFTTDSIEGQLLLAALAFLTSIDCNQIKNGEYGGMNNPDEVIKRVSNLANEIFHEEEYKVYKNSIKRQDKIECIINEKPSLRGFFYYLLSNFIKSSVI